MSYCGTGVANPLCTLSVRLAGHAFFLCGPDTVGRQPPLSSQMKCFELTHLHVKVHTDSVDVGQHFFVCQGIPINFSEVLVVCC